MTITVSRRQCLSLALFPCSISAAQAGLPRLSEMMDPIRRLTGTAAGTLRLCLLDTSATVPATDRELYKETARSFMAQAEAGDLLLLSTIADAGMDRFRAQSFSLAKTGRHFEDRKLKQERLRDVNTAIDALLEISGTCKWTRLLETLAAAQPDINRALAKGMAVRVQLDTDGIEESPLINFAKGVSESAGTALLKKLHQSRLLMVTPPEPGKSHNLEVSIVGSGGSNADRYQSIHRFWEAYVKACGGQLTYYGRVAMPVLA